MVRDDFFAKYGVTIEPHAALHEYFVVRATGLQAITPKENFTHVLACPNFGRPNPTGQITEADKDSAYEHMRNLAAKNRLYTPNPHDTDVKTAISPAAFD